MDLNRFTEKAQEALAGSQQLAVRLGHQQVDVEHLLLSLLDQEQGLAPAILTKAQIPVDALKLRVHRELEKLPRVFIRSSATADMPARTPMTARAIIVSISVKPREREGIPDVLAKETPFPTFRNPDWITWTHSHPASLLLSDRIRRDVRKWIR